MGINGTETNTEEDNLLIAGISIPKRTILLLIAAGICIVIGYCVGFWAAFHSGYSLGWKNAITLCTKYFGVGENVPGGLGLYNFSVPA
jgi:hypothetical protein